MNEVFQDLDRPDWAVDPEDAVRRSGQLIRDVLEASGKQQLVIGLSGGIDSAVAAGMAVHAIGVDNVHGVMMPYATSSAASVEDATAVAETLGITTEIIAITAMADPFLANIPELDKVRRGNIMARCRMIVLYDQSAARNALVLGTGNRTEALLGYTTLFGDSACALNPVGQLYKTEIRLLAAWLGLPRVVLDKVPSADLWEGQADEDELGFTYAEADRLLHEMFDNGRQPHELEAMGFDGQLVTDVAARVRTMAFKRQLAPVAIMPGRLDPDAGVGTDFTDGGFH